MEMKWLLKAMMMTDITQMYYGKHTLKYGFPKSSHASVEAGGNTEIKVKPCQKDLKNWGQSWYWVHRKQWNREILDDIGIEYEARDCAHGDCEIQVMYNKHQQETS